MESKVNSYGSNSAYQVGTLELYKNGKQIRRARFDKPSMRKKVMKSMLQYSDLHLNNYHFIIKLDD